MPEYRTSSISRHVLLAGTYSSMPVWAITITRSPVGTAPTSFPIARGEGLVTHWPPWNVRSSPSETTQGAQPAQA
jgi:hypothetical protein